jgi:putative acetyltransferase
MLSFAAEIPTDIAPLRALLIAAFGGTGEADLVEMIRQSPNFIPKLSLVAREDGDAIAHVLFSSITIEGRDRTISALALAPLAVTPQRQNQGIGSQLVEFGLSKCRELGHGIVVVVGEPDYYQRFGFQSASQFGLTSSLVLPDEVFMAMEIDAGALRDVGGLVRYPAYFDGV